MIIDKEKLVKDLLNTLTVDPRCISQIIDGCEIKISSSPGPILKTWKPKPGKFMFFGDGRVLRTINDLSYRKAGSERGTGKAAWLACERMVRTNRLSALAHELGGEIDFICGESNHYIYRNNTLNKYETRLSVNRNIPCNVYMTKECAVKICEMLNSGEVTL